MSAGTSNRDGRPSNPALTTGTHPPRGAPLELALPFDYALKIFGRSQPRRDGPGQPCAFFRWPPTRLPGGFPAPPIFDGGIVPEHLTTPLLLGAFFSLLRHGLRRCGAPGQRPSLFPAVPHRPTAFVRFSTRPLGRRWLWDSRDAVPTLRANAGPAVLWAHFLVTRAAGVQVQFPTPAPLTLSPSIPPRSSGDWTFLILSPYD